MNKIIKYIVVHAGARDSYILSKALLNNHRLRLLITDFAVFIKGIKYQRGQIPLPRKYYVHFPLYFLLSKISGIVNDSFFSKIFLSRILQEKVENNIVIIYSYYANHCIEQLKKRGFKIVIFQVHPTVQYVQSRLAIATAETLDFKYIDSKNIVDKELESSLDSEIEQYNFDCVDAIICASSETESSLKFSGYGGVIYKLPYYSRFESVLTDELLLKKLELYTSGDPIQIIYIGSVSIRKGILHLIDELLSMESSKYVLHICTRESINIDLIVPFINRVSIKIHQNKSDNEVRKMLINSQFLVLPSYVEGFGHTIIEAVSQGTPVIATGNTSLPDLVQKFEVGFLCEDVKGIAMKISEGDFVKSFEYENYLKNCKKLMEDYNEVRYEENLKLILRDIEENISNIYSN
jgi:glycosyltransferase involved in cell wall biosynthesis